MHFLEIYLYVIVSWYVALLLKKLKQDLVNHQVSLLLCLHSESFPSFWSSIFFVHQYSQLAITFDFSIMIQALLSMKKVVHNADDLYFVENGKI